MDYRISSLESDVGRMHDELRGMSGRIFNLELEREHRRARRERWETLLQALLMFFGMMMFVISLVMH